MFSANTERIFDRGGSQAARIFAVEQAGPNAYHPCVILERHPEIQRLSASEKLVLVTELWDDLAAHPADVPVTPDEIAELDRRMEEYRKDPSQVTTWDVIKQRILGSAA